MLKSKGVRNGRTGEKVEAGGKRGAGREKKDAVDGMQRGKAGKPLAFDSTHQAAWKEDQSLTYDPDWMRKREGKKVRFLTRKTFRPEALIAHFLPHIRSVHPRVVEPDGSI